MEFIRLKASVTWDDAVCINAFRTGCTQEMRDILHIQLNSHPETLQGVADLHNKIDLEARQWAEECAGRASSTTP